jgi:hypothetical protein
MHRDINNVEATITSKCVLVHSGFHWILNKFGHFYHDETSQPFSEHRLVIMNNELVHCYLVKQCYFKMKYKFTKPFQLLVN